ncbi:MAG TPA: hypothetical protein VN326_14975 [Casimicrobiaceae bacterium]|nr:hypothetical protein [Casimicrobiaceae bacterium]
MLKAKPMELCQPPRAVIHKPKLRVPPLSCDCHAHILGPPSRFPYEGYMPDDGDLLDQL